MKTVSSLAACGCLAVAPLGLALGDGAVEEQGKQTANAPQTPLSRARLWVRDQQQSNPNSHNPQSPRSIADSGRTTAESSTPPRSPTKAYGVPPDGGNGHYRPLFTKKHRLWQIHRLYPSSSTRPVLMKPNGFTGECNTTEYLSDRSPSTLQSPVMTPKEARRRSFPLPQYKPRATVARRLFSTHTPADRVSSAATTPLRISESQWETQSDTAYESLRQTKAPSKLRVFSMFDRFSDKHRKFGTSPGETPVKRNSAVIPDLDWDVTPPSKSGRPQTVDGSDFVKDRLCSMPRNPTGREENWDDDFCEGTVVVTAEMREHGKHVQHGLDAVREFVAHVDELRRLSTLGCRLEITQTKPRLWEEADTILRLADLNESFMDNPVVDERTKHFVDSLQSGDSAGGTCVDASMLPMLVKKVAILKLQLDQVVAEHQMKVQ